MGYENFGRQQIKIRVHANSEEYYNWWAHVLREEYSSMLLCSVFEGLLLFVKYLRTATGCGDERLSILIIGTAAYL